MEADIELKNSFSTEKELNSRNIIMTLKNSKTPACAACSYQRRKCTSSCLLAPYFPAHKAKTFRSVHRLFGVSNVTEVLKGVKDKEKRDDAMASMIYEADMREKFPVRGCVEAINHLSLLLKHKLEEHRIYAMFFAFLPCIGPINTIDPPPTPTCWTQTRFGDVDLALSSHGLNQFLTSNNNNNGLFNVNTSVDYNGIGFQGQENSKELIRQENQGLLYNVTTDDNRQISNNETFGPSFGSSR